MNDAIPENYVTDTYRKALDIALNELGELLREAVLYLHSDEHPMAAIGTLLEFDDRAEQVRAALRLYKHAMRTQRRQK